MAWHKACSKPDRTGQGSEMEVEIIVMIEAVLLDIDGTLIDNNALHLLAWVADPFQGRARGAHGAHALWKRSS